MLERELGVWTAKQALVPSDSEIGDAFGSDLAVDGDVLVVGASGKDPVGAAYVFRFDGTSWVEEAKLLSADQQIVESFGVSVCVDGGTVVVGAYASRFPRPDLAFCPAGSAHVFEQTASGWGETDVLLPAAPDSLECGGLFGFSVALVDAVVYVGALSARALDPTTGNVIAPGAVYTFERTASGWAARQTIFPDVPKASQRFAWSLAVEGDTLVVGSPWEDAPCRGNAGAAYVFVRRSGAWIEDERLVASDCSGYFGDALSLEGDTLVVGAESTLPAGAAYVFARTPSGWVEEDKLESDDGSPGDAFGRSVALSSEDAVLVAAPLLGPALTSPVGAAYAFERRTASSTLRNAGANPTSYVASPPVLGRPWNASVDLSTTGHTHARVFGRTSSAAQVQPGGQVLLIGGARVFDLPLIAGPSATWSVVLPLDPALAALPVYTQAVHLLGAPSFALSNAQDLVVGY